MDIKKVHILFISISILTAIGFGVWALVFTSTQELKPYASYGVMSLLVGVILIAYGINFLKKSREI